jgi:cyclase
MKRLLVACLGMVLVAMTAIAQEQDFSKVEIKTTKVGGNVYMLAGAGGNIGASVGDDGIVIIDDEFAPLADKIKAALKGITDKPVRFVINTHYHGDHTGSNAQFSQSGSTVIAQDNVRKRMETGGTAGASAALKEEYKASPKEALPIVTFDDKATVWLNGEEIRAIHFPAGHTDGDAVIWFVKSNVVHMGDDFVTYGYPFVDVLIGGSVSGMIAGCEKVLATVPTDAKFIPGHGPISTADDIRKYVQMLKDTRAAVEAEVKKGRTVEEIKKANVLAKWNDSLGKGFIKPDVWVDTLYDDIQHSKAGAKYVNHGHADEKK